ncbi:hypothetical protein [Micrococcoides hystricis]|uniref:Uncharacterized protein n=1 Tax=Micrococcoides hystricis TaxID=1572761 RepID=A0ABV6PDT0_9MICC
MRVTLSIDPQGDGTEVGSDTVISADTALTFHADCIILGATNKRGTFVVQLPETFRLSSSEPFTLKNLAGTTLANCQSVAPAAALAFTIVDGPHQRYRR